jgi:hypothetical protein
MAGSLKHGAHRYDLSLAALAAGSAADTSNVFPWDGYADGGPGLAVSGPATAYTFPYDTTAEEVFEFVYTVDTTYTGQATNFASICFRLIRAAAVLNDLRVVYNAAGVTTAAFTLVSMAAASGAVLFNAGTGVLTVSAGSTLPWTLQQGDILQLLRLSNNATGQATPGIGGAFKVRQKAA